MLDTRKPDLKRVFDQVAALSASWIGCREAEKLSAPELSGLCRLVERRFKKRRIEQTDSGVRNLSSINEKIEGARLGSCWTTSWLIGDIQSEQYGPMVRVRRPGGPVQARSI